jgi:hypothetical protein
MVLEKLISARGFLATAGMWDGLRLHVKKEQAREQERRISTGCTFFLVDFVPVCYHRIMRWPRMRVRRLVTPTLIILAVGTLT